MVDSPYVMRISLNVLEHLGLSLYSNTSAVLAEAIANSWDADAQNVAVHVDENSKTISVKDDGVGMSLADINEKFLCVGYRKRSGTAISTTPGGRKPMGRKGIGKLSLFSIANSISVYTRKAGVSPESFLMDARKIRAAIEAENTSTAREYKPERIPFDQDVAEHGTIIKIADLKKLRLTGGMIGGLKKRIARRFSVIDDDFRIFVNGDQVAFSDRDYFHKARFIFQYGADYANHCNNLDHHENQPMKYDQPCRFDESGRKTDDGIHMIKGWIAISHRSNDLDGKGGDEDNLNKIAIAVRGKVAQEDVLQGFRLGGMITKYMFGEINADFLDQDDKDDIATSSRQSISEDDPRFKALKSFLRTELQYIWTQTNKLKDKKGLEKALQENLPLKEWYDDLPRKLQPRAAKIFAEIDKANIDEDKKKDFYANGVLAFERLKLDSAAEVLDNIDESNIESFLDFLADVDVIEAAHYGEIVNERLKVIQRLQKKVAEDVLERVLQEYIFDHLWLLDPAWERATQYERMEERIQADLPKDSAPRKTLRLDIRYVRVAAEHVVLELKRASRQLTKTEIEEQLRKYMRAVRKKIKDDPSLLALPVQGICLVGKLPQGWENPDERRADEDSLRPHRIRVITYTELINNAESAYAQYMKVASHTRKLNVLLDKIRNYKHEEVNGVSSTVN